MLLVAERGRHHAARGMVPIGVEIFAFIQRQVLDQRLAPHALAQGPRAPDRLMRILGRDMDDVKRHARHVGDHDGAVRGLPLDLRGAGIGMRLGAGIALGKQFRGQLGHHIAVFGMDHGDAAQFRQPVERGEQLIVIDHERALIGHEMLEGVDPAILNHGLHLVEDLLTPPCHGHVVGIIAIGTTRFVVPHLESIEQTLTGAGQGEVDHHRGPARQRRARAAFKIIGGIGAHEGHFQMRMRIDPTRHDVTARGIQHRVALEVGADFGDPACFDPQIGGIAQIGRHDRSAFDHSAHRVFPRLCFDQLAGARTQIMRSSRVRSGKKVVSTGPL